MLRVQPSPIQDISADLLNNKFANELEIFAKKYNKIYEYLQDLKTNQIASGDNQKLKNALTKEKENLQRGEEYFSKFFYKLDTLRISHAKYGQGSDSEVSNIELNECRKLLKTMQDQLDLLPLCKDFISVKKVDSTTKYEFDEEQYSSKLAAYERLLKETSINLSSVVKMQKDRNDEDIHNNRKGLVGSAISLVMSGLCLIAGIPLILSVPRQYTDAAGLVSAGGAIGTFSSLICIFTSICDLRRAKSKGEKIRIELQPLAPSETDHLLQNVQVNK